MAFKLTSRRTPNVSRRDSTRPIYLALHTTEGSFAGAASWLCNPAAEASADEVISHDGTQVCALTWISQDVYSWNAAAANRLIARAFECEDFVNDAIPFPVNFYNTVAKRLIAAQKAAKREFGVTIPLRYSARPGDPGIVFHGANLSHWYAGSDHARCGEDIGRAALLAAIKRNTAPAPVRLAKNARFVWADWLLHTMDYRRAHPQPPHPLRIPKEWWAAVRWMQAQRKAQAAKVAVVRAKADAEEREKYACGAK